MDGNAVRLRVEQARRGDQEAFGELVKLYSNAIYGAAYGILGDFHLAQDVAQETLIKAWYKLERLRDPHKFSSWVIAIARRVCLDKLRGEPNPVQPLECARGLPSLQSLEEDYQVRSTRTAVREALHELDEKYRIVTVMHHIGGYSAREIAQMLDLKVSAVESRLRRARQKLKEELYDMVHDFLEDNRLEEQKFEKEVTSRLKSLFHMQIPVKNMEESIAWYNQNLGFALRENYGKCAFLELPTGPLLMLWQTADDTSANFTVDGGTMPVLLYATDDVHAMHDSLAKNGAVITHYKNEDFGWVLKFMDPNGNMWGVVQEHSGS